MPLNVTSTAPEFFFFFFFCEKWQGSQEERWRCSHKHVHNTRSTWELFSTSATVRTHTQPEHAVYLACTFVGASETQRTARFRVSCQP